MGAVARAAYSVAGALRLARFNIDTRQTTGFHRPSHPRKRHLLDRILFPLSEGTEFLAEWYWFAAILILESWLMVSPVRLFSLKFKTWG